MTIWDWLRGGSDAARPIPEDLAESPLYDTLRRICRARAARFGVGSSSGDVFHESLLRIGDQLARNPQLTTLPTLERQRYALAVIFNVIKELARRQARIQPLDEDDLDPVERLPESDTMHECLEHCLAATDSASRDMLLEYYGCKGLEPHTAQAVRLGCTVATLRVRVLRARHKLKECISTCVGQGDAA